MLRSILPVAFAVAMPGLAVAAPQSGLTLGDVVKPENLGAQVAWLEDQVGPAFKVDGTNRVYKLGACEVGVNTHDGKTVAAFHVEISDTCTFDLTGFIADRGLPPLTQMTFGAFEGDIGGVRYLADCIKQCGNAYDPSVYGYWMGGRVDNLTNVLLEVRLVDDESIDASSAWAKAMEAAQGPDYVIDGKYNCEPKYDEVARKLFAPVKITAITVGDVAEPKPNTCS